MGDADGRVRRVDALAAGTARAECVDAEILCINLHVHFFGFRQHGDGDGRGVNAAARFGGGHALHAMDAAFVFHLAVDAAPFDVGDDFFDAADAVVVGRHHLNAPALFFGELAVHPEQLIREERRLVAAGSGADFEDDVFLIVRILRDEQHLDLSKEAVAPLLQAAQFFIGELAHVGIAALGELFSLRGFIQDRPILPDLLDERLHVAERLGVLPVLVRVRLDGRARYERHQLFVVRLDGIQLV